MSLERCGFFDAHVIGKEYDRVYLANSFARYFASFIGNGVFGGRSAELQVQALPTGGMYVVVKPGQGWINGYWYENTEDLVLKIRNADGVLSRKDNIVLRWDQEERAMYLAVVEGTFAMSAVAPELQRNADYYELKLAEVSIRAGAVNIYDPDITDERLNSTVCGVVCGVVQQLDTTEFGRQLNTFIEYYMRKANTRYEEYLNHVTNLKMLSDQAYNAYLEYLESLKRDGLSIYNAYLEWLQGVRDASTTEIKGLLDELHNLIDTDDVAGLSKRVDRLQQTFDEMDPSDFGAVPATRQVNGKALSEDITLTASDVKARPDNWMPTVEDVGAMPADAKVVKTVNGKEPDGAGNVEVDVGGGALDAYPVGAVYLSLVSTSPASLFGGSWEQISGYYLYMSNSNPGGTGGSTNFTTGGSSAANTGGTAITVPQMPTHAHPIPVTPAAGATTGTTITSQPVINTDAPWKTTAVNASNSPGNRDFSTSGSNQVHTHSMAHTHTVSGWMPYYNVYAWRRVS